MRHWDRVLPGRVLRVQHEDVVDDLEGNVRRMLDFCGLDFEPACLEFHKTERSVRTASSEQVRQPIFREGLDQWRHFEPWLEPLKDRARRRADPLSRCVSFGTKPGRNDPCPCGSGKKFKRCCGLGSTAAGTPEMPRPGEIGALIGLVERQRLGEAETRARRCSP